MIILSSPSGAGKTTLVNLLAKKNNFTISVSHTTRNPRPNEIDGKDYFFVSSEEFKRLIKNDEIANNLNIDLNLRPQNINVNCVSPGFISTAMTDQIDEKFKENIVSKIPANRLGKPEDVANAVFFLASSSSDYINGETIHVNGGLYLGWQKNNFYY